MKKSILKLTSLFVILSFVFAGNVLADNGSKKLNSEKSKVEWLGKKVTGEHSGTIKISEGHLVFKDDQLEKGSFVVDMSTIENTDIKDEGYRAKLVGHLKSDDFFGVEQHPKSTFEIVKTKKLGNGNYEVHGNITIKGITKPISFNVNMHQHGDDLHVSGKIVIDRSKFNVRYGSGSFFDNLGDKTIYDDFELSLDLYLQ
ncbi:YceI family protein [Marinifilum caeruleilacunae]|uniref:YceI family protein n=1 Tax=Marinifilum caeruleilacunae TaxID=2499076 RepID=A0ABX1WRF3_9BACT|nr:YceI family protein [Marinifilum caeruleilacunae]NOU58660.1 YceI family protein [Marinifilum caeruleilacunae]